MATERNSGSLFQSGHNLSLYQDHKARRVGDILTVVLSEQTDASKSATTNTSRDNAINLQAPTVMGNGIIYEGNPLFQANADTSMEFEGAGDSAQSNSLSGSVTVSVVEVLANGYLQIRGEKIISLNQGDEFVKLSGIVRPSDIRSDNSVLSTQVADAQITYGGSGALADANQQGWLSRFFQKIWPF